MKVQKIHNDLVAVCLTINETILGYEDYGFYSDINKKVSKIFPNCAQIFLRPQDCMLGWGNESQWDALWKKGQYFYEKYLDEEVFPLANWTKEIIIHSYQNKVGEWAE